MRANIITGAIVIGIISLVAIAYQGFVVVPQNRIDATERQHQAELRLEKANELARKQDLQDCKAGAYNTYSADWDSICDIDGKEADCTLPAYRSNQLQERYEKMVERCVDVYKAN